MKKEAGPRRRHSPFTAPGRLSVLLAVVVAVAVAVSTAEKAEGMIPVELIWGDVAGKIVEMATSLGRARRGDKVEEACWRSDIKLGGCVEG